MYQPSSSVFFETLEKVVLLVDTCHEQYYDINESGKEIWSAIVAGQTPAEMVERLVSLYEVDQIQAQQDVEEFLGYLQTLNLIELRTHGKEDL